jgi:hypothetical protein
MKETETAAASPHSLTGWQQRAVHRIQLPSGQWVKIRIPGIATIVQHGDLPDELIELALAELTRGVGGSNELTAERVAATEDREAKLQRIRELGVFQMHIVAAMLVEPALTYAEVEEAVTAGSLPEDDLFVISEIGLRARATDARGVRIGVEPLDRWAMFREAHGCADEDCEGCTKLIRLFSTSDLDAV